MNENLLLQNSGINLKNRGASAARRQEVMQRVASWWQQWRWFVLLGLWLTGYTLGCIGLHLFFPSRRLIDVFYSAFQFRSFGGSTIGTLPWPLEIARWLMPVVTGFAAFEAFGAVFRDRVREVQSRALRDHVVICGLSQKGLLLARSFRERGYRVLVVENKPNHDLLAACKESGIYALIGDVTRRETLRAARIAHAKYLFAVSDDAVNAAVIAHARDIMSASKDDNGHVLTCAAHIMDSELWRLLRRWEVSGNSAFRLQLFDVFDIGARGLLSAQPPWTSALLAAPEPSPTDATTLQPTMQAPYLLVIGAGRLAQRVVLRAVQQWQEHRENLNNATALVLKIVLVDRDASSVCELLRQRHAGLFASCEIEARDLQIGSTAFQSADLFDNDKNHHLSAIYICVGDEAQGLGAALLLRHRLETRGWQKTVPILMRTGESNGVAALISNSVIEKNTDVDSSPTSNADLRAFGLLEYSCHPELVLGGTSEVLARSLHDNYLREQKRLAPDENNPALAQWDDLSELIKEKNRRQADFIGTQLRLEGCDIAPIADWEAKPFAFTPEETERMAQREHARWLQEQQSGGWTLGARDAARKTNPNLLPWEQLPPNVQEMNRQTARQLPQFLARAGFQVFRL